MKKVNWMGVFVWTMVITFLLVALSWLGVCAYATYKLIKLLF